MTGHGAPERGETCVFTLFVVLFSALDKRAHVLDVPQMLHNFKNILFLPECVIFKVYQD